MEAGSSQGLTQMAARCSKLFHLKEENLTSFNWDRKEENKEQELDKGKEEKE
jgi:hypothetical protein